MSDETTEKANSRLDELKKLSHPHHTVNVFDLLEVLETLRSENTTPFQQCFQQSASTNADSIINSIETWVLESSASQPCPTIIENTTDIVAIIKIINEQLNGLHNATELLEKSKGCTQIKYLDRVHIQYDVLENMIKLYNDYLTEGLPKK